MELKLSEVLEDNENKRFDPEFFNKTAQAAYVRLKHQRRFGDLVKSGYRVIYENTNAITRNNGITAGLPFFLQAADIQTPFISDEEMICVSQADWVRYPKGRVIPGEILIEVKGKAEKVAIVSENFPKNTLVTGTLYKMLIRDELDKYLLIAYLTCRYGQALKNRLKTNLLVSFISKADLFNLPVPDFDTPLKKAIKQSFLSAEYKHGQSRSLLKQAEQTLLSALGLEGWQPPEPLTYTRRSSEVFAANRLDSEFFQPKYESLLDALSENFELLTLDQIGKVTKGITVPYSEEGTVPIIRSGDLSDLGDDGKFLRSPSDIPLFKLHRGDVLISSIGFGSIGKVQVFDKLGTFGTVSEVTVIRQKRLNSYYLHFYLRSIAGQLQIERFITGATGQLHLYPKDVSKFFVPVIPETEQAKLEELAKSTEVARREARELLERAKRAVEIAIEDSETAALAHLIGD